MVRVLSFWAEIGRNGRPLAAKLVAMERPSDNKPSNAAVAEFLGRYHGRPVDGLESLGGGFWSAAYGYRVGLDELVLRIGDTPDGFLADQRAMAWGSEALPVPDLIDVGQALGRWFAVSRRHHGRFLEEVAASEAAVLGPTVVGLLAALRGVRRDQAEQTQPAKTTLWHDWLDSGLADRPGSHTAGWRDKLLAKPAATDALVEAERRIASLLEACPDRGQLVHSDLLHYNVLVADGADAVTAVFSWKCSTWGDSAYDLAWCTFWGRWHEGIGALDLWDRVVPSLGPLEAADIEARHHAYELHIGASHLGWFATLGDDEMLAWTTAQLDEILERGPLRVRP